MGAGACSRYDPRAMPREVYEFADLKNWSTATQDAELPLRLAVIGDPVAHSASPPMHNAALEHCGLPVRYTRLHLRPEEVEEAFRLLPGAGFLGINVTIPHKVAAMKLVDRLDDHARRIGVVNTVVVEDGALVGFNTDGPGLVRAVRSEFGVDLKDLRVMVLGAAGGAGRAVAMQCAIERCERLVLVNRTEDKARELAAELEPAFEGPRVSGPHARLEVVPFEEERLARALPEVDIIINCTSLGLKPSDPLPLPSALLQPFHMIYDTVYAASRTKFMRAAEAAGARAANGLSMLLHQGALSFEIWFGREAPLEVMRSALQQAQAARLSSPGTSR